MVDNEKKRNKTWNEKVIIVKNSIERAKTNENFIQKFYENLFFLNPKLKSYFKNTNWKQQQIALTKAIDHMVGFFLDDKNDIHHKNLVRIGESHSKKNINIHPHVYYYWIDAMIMTLSELDHKWVDSYQFYVRESLFFPVSFIISLYHK